MRSTRRHQHSGQASSKLRVLARPPAERARPREVPTATSAPVSERLTGERLAGVCGLLGAVTATVGLIAGDLAQPRAFSPSQDDISDLGALTASSPWLYNQLGSNLSGLLIIALGIGLWHALSPSRLGRLGAAAVAATGGGVFLDGLFRLDCQAIDVGCSNDSWHSHAHKIESGITAGATLLAPLILAFAFRRIPAWRDSWIVSLATVPAIILANVVFSAIGDGAATRAGTVVVFLWIAFIGLRLLQKGETAAAAVP
jgi:hypothetical protein